MVYFSTFKNCLLSPIEVINNLMWGEDGVLTHRLMAWIIIFSVYLYSEREMQLKKAMFLTFIKIYLEIS